MSTGNESTDLTVCLDTTFEEAEERVVAELKKEGFGVLTEIDVKSTLKQKLDVDFRPYKILGACNPRLAYRALQAAPEVGLLLPCNVTVSQVEADRILVSIIDPMQMADFVDNSKLDDIAGEAEAKLKRVATALKAPHGT
jgi:uncharacterized protein (DUF302 family)